MVGEAKTTDSGGTGGLRLGSRESRAEGFWSVFLGDAYKEGRKAGWAQAEAHPQ